MDYNLEQIIQNFCIEGSFYDCKKYGNGHINDTFLVTAVNSLSEYTHYILQRINNTIFQEPLKLVENIYSLTSFLKEKIIAEGGNYLRETLNIILTRDHSTVFTDGTNYWRMYLFIEDSITYEKIENAEIMYRAGIAFGHFQNLLSDFPAHKLYESIQDFHNTPKRLEALLYSYEQDICGRAAAVKKEMDFIMKYQEECGIIMEKIRNGSIPLRVTHNDTKLNNILFDAHTKQGICVIDLDTVMPGSLLFDFGDTIRFAANTGAEDEKDLSLVSLNLDYYHAFANGFLEELKNSITEQERELMPLGAKIMTLECGIRFLTDYLSGDTYFKIHCEDHNLIRAKAQLKLVEDIDSKLSQMKL